MLPVDHLNGFVYRIHLVYTIAIDVSTSLPVCQSIQYCMRYGIMQKLNEAFAIGLQSFMKDTIASSWSYNITNCSFAICTLYINSNILCELCVFSRASCFASISQSTLQMSSLYDSLGMFYEVQFASSSQMLHEHCFISYKQHGHSKTLLQFSPSFHIIITYKVGIQNS